MWYSRFQSPVETNRVTVKVTARVIECHQVPDPELSPLGPFVIRALPSSMKQAEYYPFVEEGAGAQRHFKKLAKVPDLGSAGAESGWLQILKWHNSRGGDSPAPHQSSLRGADSAEPPRRWGNMSK